MSHRGKGCNVFTKLFCHDLPQAELSFKAITMPLAAPSGEKIDVQTAKTWCLL